MVTRNAPYEKREHALSFTFRSVAGRLIFGETIAERRFRCTPRGCILAGKPRKRQEVPPE
jgi:hypothetical protein